MTVKELKRKCEQFDDDAIVMIQHIGQATIKPKYRKAGDVYEGEKISSDGVYYSEMDGAMLIDGE